MLEGKGEVGLEAYAKIHSVRKQQSPPLVAGSRLGEAGGELGLQDMMGEATV